MVGKALKVKCRVVLDHLNVKRITQAQTTIPEVITQAQTSIPEVITQVQTTIPEVITQVQTTIPETIIQAQATIPEIIIQPQASTSKVITQAQATTPYNKRGREKLSERIISTPVLVKPEPEVDKEEDIAGTIFELEQDEISTPKGPRKGKLGKSPDFPRNPHWIKPEVLLQEMWEKKFVLKAKGDKLTEFRFPSDPSVVMRPYLWQIPELCALKDELNKVKSSLDRLPLDPWHCHTKQMNIAHSVMSYVKRYFNPEFSSQAWGKMFEILCSYDIIPGKVLDEIDNIFESKERQRAGDKAAFDTVHLCEAPGAFISALNHFLKISYTDIDWNWLATTLNPYHESNDVGKMINDDRLILKSMENWTFLEDNTGNILSHTNLNYLIKMKINKLDKVREEKSGTKESQVYLVTADGSIDCQTNPGEQEAMVSHLQFAEILTAMMILQKGGSFVLKVFTFLEATTICHLYLLSCVFREVHLFKPATSKEGNSEVYVICLDYLGPKSIEPVLQNKLLPNLEKYGKLLEQGKLLLPLEAIPKVFIDRIIESAQFFCNYQMKIIRRNLSTFPCDTRMYSVMKPFRKEAAEEWIEWSQIKPLNSTQRLFNGDADDFKMARASHLDMRSEQGCFADKVFRQSASDWQKLEAFKSELMFHDSWRGPQNQVVYGSAYKVGPIGFELPYGNVRCSRFCYGKLLSTREEIREIVGHYMTELHAQGLGNMENVCSGHSTKRVYDSMSKSCDFESKNLEVLCFTKLTWQYGTKTDFDHQKKDLQKLFDAVQDIGKDRSMFLCRFPMLTRLQTGFIFCLASVFEKIIIYGDPSKNVVGIMLHKFKGLSQPHDKNMFRCIADILKVLNDPDHNYPCLQLVPMKLLLDCMPSEFLVRYNTLILCQDMLRTINVVECIIRLSDRNFGGVMSAHRI